MYNSDTKLIKACLAQDKVAWDMFVEKYSRLICHAIVNTLKKYSTAPENQMVDDLFHTVFLSLIEKNYKKLRQFQWKCKLSSWLHIIAVRTTIDYLRKQSKHLSLNGETQEEISLSLPINMKGCSGFNHFPLTVHALHDFFLFL